MTKINFKTKLVKIKTWVILRLPPESSAMLPSRGMIMVSVTLNNISFNTLLEPDGRYGKDQEPSHWFRIDEKILNTYSLKVDDTVDVSIEPTKEWIEPEIPDDLTVALKNSSKAKETWDSITPMARWDWTRWIRAVKTDETRNKHIQVAIDKLNKGMRRPCCFNRNLCSEPYVSHNWRLLDSE